MPRRRWSTIPAMSRPPRPGFPPWATRTSLQRSEIRPLGRRIGSPGWKPWAGALAAVAVCAGALFAAAPAPQRGDVLLVTIDTLRADSLGFAGNRRVQTPVLDRLASQGRVFPNAHAHNVVTLPSHANILTGLYPYQH
ncbi:hypothetical protein EHM82_05450, partial [bacterium]